MVWALRIARNSIGRRDEESQEGNLCDPRPGEGHIGKGRTEEEPAGAVIPCLCLLEVHFLEHCQEFCVGPRAQQLEPHMMVRRPIGPSTPSQITKLWLTSQFPPGWHSRDP